MVVRIRTQQLLHSGKNFVFSKNIQLRKRPGVFNFGGVYRNQVQYSTRPNVRLCVFRCYHSSREPRTTPGKLSPQEVTACCAAAGSGEPECGEYFGYSCLDCHTQMICAFGTAYTQTCKSSGSRNIYCNPKTAECTDEPPLNCTASRVQGFKCPRANGVFPDLHNCSRYLKCQNDFVQTLECPAKYVYNQTLGTCIYKLENSDCSQVKCDSASAVHTYPGDSSLYYQCTEGEPKLFACPENQVYNVTAKRCQSVCTRSGLLANPKNCSEFISCQVSGPAYVATKKTCPPGRGFNPISGVCQIGFDRLCSEIASVSRAWNNLIPLPNFIKSVIELAQQFVASLNINISIPSFLLKLGFSYNFTSLVLRIAAYVLTHGLFSLLLLRNMIDLVLSFLPRSLRTLAELFIGDSSGKSSMLDVLMGLLNNFGKFSFSDILMQLISMLER